MHQCIRQTRQLNEKIKQIEKTIGKLAFENEDTKRIMSITEFDSFGALLISLGIDGIDRFTTPKKLVS